MNERIIMNETVGFWVTWFLLLTFTVLIVWWGEQ